jgi:hypothetical protein
MRKLGIRGMLVTIATAAMAVGIAPIARADEDQLVVNVPFSFIVGDTRLPAGSYIVKEMSENTSVLSIASKDGRHYVLTMTIPLRADEAAAQPELVFEKYADQYFLARVLTDDGGSRAIPLTDAKMAHEIVKVTQNQ